MTRPFFLTSSPKIGAIDPTTQRPFLVRHLRRTHWLAAEHLLTSFVAVERSESTVAWQFEGKLPRATSRKACWDMLLMGLGQHPLTLNDLHSEWVAVTQYDWLALAGVLEVFKGITPRSTRTIETRGEADECETKWVQKTTWDFLPAVEIVGKKGEGFRQALRAAVQQGRIKIERKTPIAGLTHCVRDEVDTLVAFHGALRQLCDSSATSAAFHFIHAFQEAEKDRMAAILHTAIRRCAHRVTMEDLVEGISQHLCDADHMAFHDHGHLWRAFCAVLGAFQKDDWEAVLHPFVAFQASDATMLPAGFLLSDEGMPGMG